MNENSHNSKKEERKSKDESAKINNESSNNHNLFDKTPLEASIVNKESYQTSSLIKL